MAGLTGWHFLIVLAVVLLLFGATKLPALAKGLGESMRIFKSEIKKPEDTTPGAANTPPAASTPPAAAYPPAAPTYPADTTPPADPAAPTTKP
ncbi:MAG: twin-arginine translocase TatA/TatE family subunit [Glaciihabitans sp.]